MKTTELLGTKVFSPSLLQRVKACGRGVLSWEKSTTWFAPFKQGQPSQVVGVMVQKPDIAVIIAGQRFCHVESLGDR